MADTTREALIDDRVPVAAIEDRAVDWVDVSGWGVFKAHPIPVEVARYIAEKINLYHAHRAALATITAERDRLREALDYQPRVQKWMLACFNDEIAFSVTERNHRFLEEAVELVQAQGCTASEAHQLVDYVFGRDVGEPVQEVGGVLVCLAALCSASGIDMNEAGERELARIWTKVEKIRAKHAAKPQFSPLPGAALSPDTTEQSNG